MKSRPNWHLYNKLRLSLFAFDLLLPMYGPILERLNHPDSFERMAALDAAVAEAPEAFVAETAARLLADEDAGVREQAARVIVSEGTSTVMGRGMPAGAPGEVAFEVSGQSITRYIWDPERGVMLASSSSTRGSGELEVMSMQMLMPMTYEGGREVRLRR